MESIINEIFNSLKLQFIDPIGSGLWGIIEPVWIIAIAIAVLGLIFGFGGMKRGVYAGMLIGLVVFGFVFFGWGDRVVTEITHQANPATAAYTSSAPDDSTPQPLTDIDKLTDLSE